MQAIIQGANPFQKGMNYRNKDVALKYYQSANIFKIPLLISSHVERFFGLAT